jgi:hypothetical protein
MGHSTSCTIIFSNKNLRLLKSREFDISAQSSIRKTEWIVHICQVGLFHLHLI